MRFKLLKGAALVALGLGFQAHAYDCNTLDQWNPVVSYAANDKVKHAGYAFKARRSNQGKTPIVPFPWDPYPWLPYPVADQAGQADQTDAFIAPPFPPEPWPPEPWPPYPIQFEAWSVIEQCSSGPVTPEPEPLVSFVSPVQGAQLTEGSVINLEINTAKLTADILSVEFYTLGIFGNLDVLPSINTPPYSMEWTVSPLTEQIGVSVHLADGSVEHNVVGVIVEMKPRLSPPRVNITNPTQEQFFREGTSVAIQANASDYDGSVQQVEFFIDNQLVETDTVAPYELNWVAVAGNHTVKAKATDNDNLTTTTKEVAFTVLSSDQPNGCVDALPFVAGTKYVAGDLVTNEGRKYRCDIGGWCSSTAEWAYAPGTGNHWQDAWTDQGQCAVLPEVSITQPTQNTTVIAGSTVAIAADAFHLDGPVAQVEFFVDNQSIAIDSLAPYTAEWVATLGQHPIRSVTVKAVATDIDGNSAETTTGLLVQEEGFVLTPIVDDIVYLSQPTSLAANVSSTSNDIQYVEFTVDGQVVGTDDTAPYSIDWIPNASGTFTVGIHAVDSAGNRTTNDSISVTVIHPLETNTIKF